MNTAPTIADLEATSDAACAANDRAVARLAKIQSVMDALMRVDDARGDAELSEADHAQIETVDAAACYVYLYNQKIALRGEIDRLETACHEAARALNSAPEVAA